MRTVITLNAEYLLRKLARLIEILRIAPQVPACHNIVCNMRTASVRKLRDDFASVLNWIEQGEAEAEFQLGYHYLRCTPGVDDPTRERMEALVKAAAAKDHPDALWFVATH